MRVLLCHNHYQLRGGEDLSFEDEAWLLRSRGHSVGLFELRNEAIHDMTPWGLVRRTIWNSKSANQLRHLIRREKPDVLHCTNIFPLISPSVYSAARSEGIPVVQGLHNYRLICPNACLFRDGRVCEDCLGKLFPWPGIVHGCYRDSRAASAVVATMLGVHRWLDSWNRGVTRYVTPSEFSRLKLIEGGLPADRISVKPNFLRVVPEFGAGAGNYAVFVGRLSPEKGLNVLLDAWKSVASELDLKIVGDGPLSALVQAAASADPRIVWLGHRPTEEVLSIIGNARFLVMPSIWYETFGRTIIEAFAKATPVVVSDAGAMSELVSDGRTGLHFKMGDPVDLAEKVRFLVSNRSFTEQLRMNARHEFEKHYTAELNYRMLMDLYELAIASYTRNPR